MTVSTAQKLAAVERLLDDLRWSRGSQAPEAETYDALLAIAGDLRAGTPAEMGRVLRAMTDQINRARKGKSRLSFYDVGHMQTLTEAICGRWWPVIENALRQYERETAS